MSFQQFYNVWLDELRQIIQQLNHSLKKSGDDDHRRQLVQKTMEHYTEYYRSKSMAVKQDVLAFFSATWATSLERALHWIGGWRPTTAYHLVYTESSILFESQVVDIIRGVHSGDLGDLSPSQFQRVSELQCETVREEDSITDELAEWQDDASDVVGMCGDMEAKMVRLTSILERADHLRLKTVRDLVELLTTQQAAELLVAATELYCGIRAWGVDQDRHRQHTS